MSWSVERLRELIATTTLEDIDDPGPFGSVYFIIDLDMGRCKIGFTQGDVKKRLASLQTGSPSVLALLALHPGTPVTERRLHERFSDSRLHGEWFNVSDELRAYLVRVVWAMSEIALSNGRPLEQWMRVCLTQILDSLGDMPESLASLIEAEPA